MIEDVDLRVPLGSPGSAWADGYSARCSGVSRYANPWAERAQEAGRRAGWLRVYAAAWWAGWNAADFAVGPA
jgi:hypothetical protein